MSEAKYVTYDEFAQIISCSRRYVCTLANEGVLPVVKFGRKCARIPLDKALKKIEAMEVGKK